MFSGGVSLLPGGASEALGEGGPQSPAGKLLFRWKSTGAGTCLPPSSHSPRFERDLTSPRSLCPTLSDLRETVVVACTAFVSLTGRYAGTSLRLPRRTPAAFEAYAQRRTGPSPPAPACHPATATRRSDWRRTTDTPLPARRRRVDRRRPRSAGNPRTVVPLHQSPAIRNHRFYESAESRP